MSYISRNVSNRSLELMVKLYQTLLKSSLEFDAKFGAKATEEKKKRSPNTF